MMSRPVRDLGSYAWLRHPPEILASGCALGAVGAAGGSLGALVHDPSMPGEALALTARHALVGFGDFVAGTTVLCPAPGDPGCTRIGQTLRALPLSPEGAGGSLDAALVRIDRDRAWTARHALLPGLLGAVRELGVGDVGTALRKLGCATGATAAPLRALSRGVAIALPGSEGKTLVFGTLLEIRPEGEDPWSEAGDSGALVLTEAGDPVGLVLAGGTDAQGPVSYAMPLGPILTALGVTLLGT